MWKDFNTGPLTSELNLETLSLMVASARAVWFATALATISAATAAMGNTDAQDPYRHPTVEQALLEDAPPGQPAASDGVVRDETARWREARVGLRIGGDQDGWLLRHVDLHLACPRSPVRKTRSPGGTDWSVARAPHISLKSSPSA